MYTCKKIAYKDRISALIQLAKIKNEDKSGSNECRAYKCKCGSWHLTSKKERFIDDQNNSEL